MAPMNLTGRPVPALSSELDTSAGGGVASSGLVACSVSFSRTILTFDVLCIVLCRLLADTVFLLVWFLGVEDFVMLKLRCDLGRNEKSQMKINKQLAHQAEAQRRSFRCG